MGVPSFYRWLVRRFPDVLAACDQGVDTDDAFDGDDAGSPEVPTTNLDREFDSLFLDMNGILHRASHPEGQPAPKSEDEMVETMFAFIDQLFNIVRPRKLLFMAIDGVAPRAKMNQQRARRFLAAKNRLEEERKAIEESLQRAASETSEEPRQSPADGQDPAHRFDSNVITPGTEFMARMANALRAWIARKLATDPEWKKLTIVFSDASVPGEGEHKIMEFIRIQRTQPGYNPNAGLAIYGLDADLIMLTLSLHEPRFSIIREEVSAVTCYLCHKMGHLASECPARKAKHRQESETVVKEAKRSPPRFEWLHIDILREYLEHEFSTLEWPIPFDLERVLDDFVVLCFLAGNDFLPRIPSLAIHEGAIDLLIEIYKKSVPNMRGWLVEKGEIDFKRLVHIIRKVASKEEKALLARQHKQRQLRKQKERMEKQLSEENSEDSTDSSPPKRDRRQHGQEHGKKPKKQLKGGKHKSSERSREGKHKAASQDSESEEEEDEDDEIKLGKPGWRDRWLAVKFGVDIRNHEFYDGVKRKYVEGLQWVAKYYYQGCCSWQWYYPYHYPPLASLLDNLDSVTEVPVSDAFTLGTPFKPFEQLMAVLPPASSQCLPTVYHRLMLSPESPIAEFYPTNFEIDLEGSDPQFSWAGVIKLPFVDEEKLLRTIRPLQSELTAEETQRNSTGKAQLYVGAQAQLYAQLTTSPQAKIEMKDTGGFLAGATSPTGTSVPNVICVDYVLPTLPSNYVFSPALLPGVELPPHVLNMRSYQEDEEGHQRQPRVHPHQHGEGYSRKHHHSDRGSRDAEHKGHKGKNKYEKDKRHYRKGKEAHQRD